MNRIKELREANGLSQRALAKRTNISQSAISFYESGMRTPNAFIQKTLSSFFGVTDQYLMGQTAGFNDLVRELNESYVDAMKWAVQDGLTPGKAYITPDGRKHLPPVKGDGLFIEVRRFFRLLGKKQPIEQLASNDFYEFTQKAKDFWKKNFYFVIYLDRIEALLMFNMADALGMGTSNSQLKFALEDINLGLTSTAISKDFEGSSNGLDSLYIMTKLFFYRSRRMMRFSSKEQIRNEVLGLAQLLYNFEEKLKKLPENSKEQYPLSVVNARLTKMVQKAKDRHSQDLYNYKYL